MHLLSCLRGPLRAQWFAARSSAPCILRLGTTQVRAYFAGVPSWRVGDNAWRTERRLDERLPVALGEKLRAIGTVITTDNATATNIDQILSLVQQMPSQLFGGGNPAVVLLLTPTYSFEATRDAFALRFLERLTGPLKDVTSSVAIDLVVAVVDRLPRPDSSFVPSNDHTSLSRLRIPEQNADHFEGLAYTIVQDLSVHPMPIDTHSGRIGGVGDDGETSTLTLSISRRPSSSSHASASAGVPRRNFSLSLEVPLASTLFRTGQRQTMMHYKYEISRDSNPDRPPSLTLAQPLLRASASFDFSGLEVDTTVLHTVDTRANLLPITIPDKIHSAMGNVVREVSCGHDSQQVRPASQQLEHRVPEYFKSKSIQPHSASVWALIIPEAYYLGQTNADPFFADNGPSGLADPVSIKEEDDLHRAWDQEQIPFQDGIFQVLAAGGRLVKVLSGGGGWGKRAGLLSLDPDSSFMETSDEAESITASGDPSFLTATGAAKVGDYIQFYISVPSDRLLDRSLKYRRRIRRTPSIQVGTIPSTVDDPAPAAPNQQDILDTSVSAKRRMINCYRGFFGALSEAGLGLRLTGEDGHVSRTKIDVPHSRLIFNIMPGVAPVKSVPSGSSVRPTIPIRRYVLPIPERDQPRDAHQPAADESPTHAGIRSKAIRKGPARPSRRSLRGVEQPTTHQSPDTQVAAKAGAGPDTEDLAEPLRRSNGGYTSPRVRKYHNLRALRATELVRESPSAAVVVKAEAAANKQKRLHASARPRHRGSPPIRRLVTKATTRVFTPTIRRHEIRPPARIRRIEKTFLEYVSYIRSGELEDETGQETNLSNKRSQRKDRQPARARDTKRSRYPQQDLEELSSVLRELLKKEPAPPK